MNVADFLKARAERDGTDMRGAVRDLLTDLMHLCGEYGLDFEDRSVAACEVYEDEVQS